MHKIIHTGTKITVGFGIADEEGDVVQSNEYSIELKKWDKKHLHDVLTKVNFLKKKLEEALVELEQSGGKVSE